VLAIALDPAGLALAFAAGVVAFTSPCLLPLVPAYLSLVSGVAADELAARKREVAGAAGIFVVGFGAMFVALGAGAAWFGGLLLANRRTLEIVAGVLLLAAAVLVAGVPLPRRLAVERRAPIRARGSRLFTAGAAGVAFAIAWTPCVGPTLGAVLTLAASSGSAGSGAGLLAAYALGLGVPFLAAAFLVTRSFAVSSALRRRRRLIQLVSAGLLAVFGVLVLTGHVVDLTRELARFTGWQI
jgi:cytochrome c-type biogenesis protein